MVLPYGYYKDYTFINSVQHNEARFFLGVRHYQYATLAGVYGEISQLSVYDLNKVKV